MTCDMCEEELELAVEYELSGKPMLVCDKCFRGLESLDKDSKLD